MAGAEYTTIPGIVAGADLSDSQYLVVRLDESDGTALQGNATSVSAGILVNKPETGQGASIVCQGFTYAQCTGTIAINTTRLAADDEGVLVATTTDTDEYIAHSLEAHTADGASCILKVYAVGYGGSKYAG